MSAAPRFAAGRPGTLPLAALALARMHGVPGQIVDDPAGTAGAALLGLVACGAGAGLPATVPG